MCLCIYSSEFSVNFFFDVPRKLLFYHSLNATWNRLRVIRSQAFIQGRVQTLLETEIVRLTQFLTISSYTIA